MYTPQAQETRQALAVMDMCINAQMRNPGPQRMPMRGLHKVRATAPVHVLAYKLRLVITLLSAAAAHQALARSDSEDLENPPQTRFVSQE